MTQPNLRSKKSRWIRRGNCSVCGFRVNMRKDFTAMKHWIYMGSEGRVCDGTGKPDKFATENQAARDAYKGLTQSVTITGPPIEGYIL